MTKPDWKDAPCWARYLAQDRDGAWCWYEFKPRWSRNGWSIRASYFTAMADLRGAEMPGADMSNTLEGRP